MTKQNPPSEPVPVSLSDRGETSDGPQISIAIISKDRHPVLSATVRALEAHVNASGYRGRVEIVVVEEGDVPTPLPGVVHHFLPRRDLGFGYARNRAVAACRGGIVVFVDDDVRPGRDWLDRLTAPFADPAVVAVGGGIVSEPDGLGPVGAVLSVLGFPAGNLPRMFAAGPDPVPATALSTTNCAFQRCAFDAVGGFDEALVFGAEDSVFFHRLAQIGKTVFFGQAFGYHRQRESIWAVARWAVRRGRAYFGRSLVLGTDRVAAIGPLRRSILPNLFAVAGLAVVVGLATGVLLGTIALAAGFLGWAAVVQRRAMKRLEAAAPWASPELLEARELVRGRLVGPLVPAVRFLVDIGEATGRLLMAALCLRNRFRAPPEIRFGRCPSPGAGADASSAARWTARVRGEQVAGTRFVTVSEIVRRLREMPRTLYLQPCVAFVMEAVTPADFITVRELRAEAVPVTVAIAPELFMSVADAGGSALLEAARSAAAAGVEFALAPSPVNVAPTTGADAGEDVLGRCLSVAAERLGRAPVGLCRAPGVAPAAVLPAGVQWALSARPGGPVRTGSDPRDLPWVPFVAEPTDEGVPP